MSLVVQRVVRRANIKVRPILLLTGVYLLQPLLKNIVDMLRPLCYAILKVYTPPFELCNLFFENAGGFVILIKSISHIRTAELHIEQVIQLLQREHTALSGKLVVGLVYFDRVLSSVVRDIVLRYPWD